MITAYLLIFCRIARKSHQLRKGKSIEMCYRSTLSAGNTRCQSTRYNAYSKTDLAIPSTRIIPCLSKCDRGDYGNQSDYTENKQGYSHKRKCTGMPGEMGERRHAKHYCMHNNTILGKKVRDGVPPLSRITTPLKRSIGDRHETTLNRIPKKIKF